MRDALDGAALARGIAAFEEHHDLCATACYPSLKFDQLTLQTKQVTEVLAAIDRWPVLVRGDLGELLGHSAVTELELVVFVEICLELGF